MKRIPECKFESIADLFTFGRYRGLSLADVLDINPSYVIWCDKHCTSIKFRLRDKAIEEIKIVYPDFNIDSLFEDKRDKRIDNLCYSFNDACYDGDYYE